MSEGVDIVASETSIGSNIKSDSVVNVASPVEQATTDTAVTGLYGAQMKIIALHGLKKNKFCCAGIDLDIISKEAKLLHLPSIVIIF